MKIRAVNLDAYAKFVMKDKFSNEFSIVRNDDADKLIKSKRYKSLSPANIITRLNNNRERFLPSLNKTLLIIFSDFSVWTKFKNLPKISLGRLDTSYKPDKEHIYILKKTLINKNDFYNELNKYAESFIDIDTATNITILHELGHAVHHQIEKLNGRYLHEGTEEAKFINELMSFEELAVSQHEMSGKIVEIEMIGRQATREGYADLYCCILLDKLYGRDKAGFIIKAIHDYREAVNVTERYYTHDSINEYLTSEYRLDFKNFNEIHSYISIVVSKYAIKHINSDSRSFFSHSNFLGVINSVFGINEIDVKSAVKKIGDRFPFIWVYHDKLVPWRFEHGCEDGEEWLTNRELNKTQRSKRAVKAVMENKLNKIISNHYRKRS
ncbi:hypothetical protein MUA01_03665 [Enterobacteriaceae bacterium H18W14]|uniref:hypothetical protein n=1 Tax=Dryocola boscaweniae TaxID=2925397 RepID=UPI0022F0184E|nr:hypothetical protein [Dryocola boscaweniae]MCT4714086.1 hypothetical protein [Dryocola boscaweniae]